MSLRPAASVPATGELPLCVGDDLVLELVRALPRPHPSNPADYGRKLIHRALQMVRLCAPLDVLQATLAVQLVLDQLWASHWSQVVAASAGQLNAVIRAERQGQGLKRSAAGAERRLGRQRALMEKTGETAEPEGMWDYDLAALEAIWVAGPLVGALEAEGRAGKAETPPPPKLPLWQQNGRRYIHECTDEEVDELEAAKAKGEAIAWPPYHPRDPVALGWRPDESMKSKPYKYWGDMTKQERLERYGWKSEEQLAAEKAAKAAAQAEAAQPGGSETGQAAAGD